MSRTAEPEEEMTELPRQDMNTALLDRLEDEGTTPPRQRGLKIRDWMRQLRLQILLIRIFRPFASKRTSAERRKVAIYQSRRLAILHVLLHLIPVGGAMALLYLQWSSFFLGFTSPVDPTILQFFAKFHELLMQFSIVEMTVCIIRTETLRNFVPLGALSGIAQATQLSYIWSLDFISIFVSPALCGWRKVLFVTAIPTLLVGTALVGPSSAVLMIPRSRSPRDAGSFTLYSNASYEQFLPSTIGRANGLHFDWKSIRPSMIQYDRRKYSWIENENAVEVVSEYENLASRPWEHGHLRPVRTRYDDNSISPAVISNATVPTEFIRHKFREVFETYDNYTLSVYAPQPVVQVICNSTSQKSFESDTEVKYVEDITLKTVTISTLGTLIQKLNNSGETYTHEYDVTIQSFEPVWMAAPESRSQAWVGIFFQHIYDPQVSRNETTRNEPIKLSEMISSVPSLHRYGSWEVSTCTFDASWNNSEAIYFQDGGVGYNNPYPMPPWNTSALRTIGLDYNDIDELRSPKFLQGLTSGGFELHTALALSFAVAISDIPSLSRYDSVWGEDTLSTGVNSMPPFHFTYTLYGFGYGNHSTSVRLSMAVLGFYCVITVIYLAYMLFTGRSSTAWNSSIELVTLALQSKRPDHLGKVSVGIDNLGTFNEGVGIRANADNELELVFAHDRDVGSRGLRRVQTNKEY